MTRATEAGPASPTGPAGSVFVRACRGESVARTPVWFMRQAGRSLPEYRRLRAGTTMLDACRQPDLVTEITLQPVRRHGVDAAILFSDIVLPLVAAGVDVEIVPGVGPVVADPVRDAAAVRRIRPLDDADIPFVTESVAALVAELGPVPLIGFAGGPFTLASYLVEGGPSRGQDRTRALMHAEPLLWAELADRLAGLSMAFLGAQVRAGAAAVQLFDSWVGSLSRADYRRHVLPASSRVLAGVAEVRGPDGRAVPRIHFGVGTGELLGSMAGAGAEVVGVDWRVPLDEAATRVPAGTVLQGNLDPALLLAGWRAVEPAVRDVLRRGRVAAGHVFNLGHGVLPDTDPDVLTEIVRTVRRVSSVGEAAGPAGPAGLTGWLAAADPSPPGPHGAARLDGGCVGS